MRNTNKISVAIASYNGETYIAEQLQSILQQTMPPDEIIISDDGSKDNTLGVLRKMIPDAQGLGVNIVIRTDNPRHGIGGNFEWAITHCSGNYIFICGQDDIWMPEKVEQTMRVFAQHPGAYMVCHRLALIDGAGEPVIQMRPNSVFEGRNLQENQVFKAQRKEFLESAVSNVLISGPAVCISAALVDKAMPIPVAHAEDYWLQFCAVAEDGLYYLHETLTKYRIHNSTSHSEGMGKMARLKKIFARIRNAGKNRDDLLRFSQGVLQYLDATTADDGEIQAARATAKRIYEIGTREVEASSSGRLSGAYKLTKMFCTDIRYRRKGTGAFITHLANILLYSKKKRRKDLGLPQND